MQRIQRSWSNLTNILWREDPVNTGERAVDLRLKSESVQRSVKLLSTILQSMQETLAPPALSFKVSFNPIFMTELSSTWLFFALIWELYYTHWNVNVSVILY